MKRLNLSKKIFLIFFSMTGMTFVTAVAVYLGFGLIRAGSEKIVFLKELQGQIQVLATFRPDQPNAEINHFKAEIARVRKIAQDTHRLEKGQPQDISRRLKPVVATLGYYQDAWLELVEKYNKERVLYQGLMSLSGHMATQVPKNLQLEIRKKLSRLREMAGLVYNKRDMALIGEMKQVANEISRRSNDPGVARVVQMLVGNAESCYINYLSIKEREDFLNDTTRRLILVTKDAILAISQLNNRRNILMLWVLYGLLLLSLLNVANTVSALRFSRNCPAKRASAGNTAPSASSCRRYS